MDKRYDVIVLGSDVNALLTATRYAQAGKEVLLLEPDAALGGLARTETVPDGYAYQAGWMDAGSLRLDALSAAGVDGVEFIEPAVTAFTPATEGPAITLYRDIERTVAALAEVSATDADALPRFMAHVGALAGTLETHLRRQPSLGQMAELLLNEPALVQFANVPLRETLDHWFETPALKGVLATAGTLGLNHGPYQQGSGLSFLYQYIGAGSGGFRASRFVRGGNGALVAALALAAEAAGVTLRAGTPIDQIALTGSRATGVVAGGEAIAADLVVSAYDARQTLFEWVKPWHLPPSVVRRLRSTPYRGTTAKLVAGLRRLPTFVGQTSAEQLHGHVIICPSPAYLERAADDAKYGRFSAEPALEITFPSLHTPSLAPGDEHLMEVVIRYAPYRLRDDDWATAREALAETVWATLARVAPEIRSLVTWAHLLTPADYAAEFDLTEGSWTQGQMGVEHLFAMRPLPGYAAGAAPVPGLAFCGGAAHPGGGLTGLLPADLPGLEP